MTTERQAKYIGPAAHLRGKRALIRETATSEYVVAQFDDTTLRRDGRARPYDRRAEGVWPPIDALGYGWHTFKTSDFEVVA